MLTMATSKTCSFLSLATLGTHRFKAVLPVTIVRAISRDVNAASTELSSSTGVPESTGSKVSQPLANQPGLLSRLYERYSVAGQQRRIALGRNLFHAAQRQSQENAWYAPGRVPSTFRSKHAMLTLHVWFLHRRLIRDEGTGIFREDGTPLETDASSSLTRETSLLVQEELFELLWHDSRCRIRAEGVAELTVNKHLKDVQQLTFQYCTHLDHVFEEYAGDSAKRLEELAFAMWIHILNRDEEASDDVVKRLAAYAEYQFENILFLLPERYFVEGRIGWGTMPDFSGIKDRAGKEIDLDPKREEISDTWVKALTEAGETYYWDTKTDKTQWEKPKY